MFFTNGTLIDKQFCDDLIEVGNLVPTISVEDLVMLQMEEEEKVLGMI